jgi:hypothetical protein
VPVAKFEGFRKELAHLGELRRSTIDSQDLAARWPRRRRSTPPPLDQRIM